MKLPVTEEQITTAASEAAAEYRRARITHGAFHSRHEGFAILKEECDELWEEVKKRHPENLLLRKEAKQVAAMAIAFMLEIAGDTP